MLKSSPTDDRACRKIVPCHQQPRNVELPKVPVIAIVDDDPSVCEATKSLMKSLGYIAATFTSAEEFLKSDRVQESSCLIADVQMPGMSGLDLQNQLIARGHRFPVIFITAYPAANARARAM